MDQLKKILNPKIWLLVVAGGHTLATILPVLSDQGLNLDETEVEYAVWRVVSMIIPMVFIALTFTKEIQAKTGNGDCWTRLGDVRGLDRHGRISNTVHSTVGSVGPSRIEWRAAW